MSAIRQYAQRNNNNTKLVPEFTGTISELSVSGCAVYTLTMPTVQYREGIYHVDMSDVDLSGNLLDLSGQFYPIQDENGYPISVIAFAIDMPYSAVNYPGLEFTIFFKNLPLDRLPGYPLLTIGIVPVQGESFPYIFSPPFPPTTGPNINPSVTFKSDGTAFNVCSSGPAGWLGYPALSVILSAYQVL